MPIPHKYITTKWRAQAYDFIERMELKDLVSAKIDVQYSDKSFDEIIDQLMEKHYEDQECTDS